MGERGLWNAAEVKTDIYVKVQELSIILQMTIGKMLVLSHGAFSPLTLNAKKPLPPGLRGRDSMDQPLEIRNSSKVSVEQRIHLSPL